MAGGEYKYIFGQNKLVPNEEALKRVQIGIVASVDDPNSLGRIKAVIQGPAQKGGDDGLSLDELAWCYPMVPKFFLSTPKVGEAVFIFILNDKKTHADRLYLGPIISQLNKLDYDSINSTALSSFSFALLNPTSNFDTIPALKGVFPLVDDISIQGRYNTDIILRENEILIRAGKFVESTPTQTNPYNFQFNNTTQGYFHIKNNVYLEAQSKSDTRAKGSVANIIANKINLISLNGTPQFNVLQQDGQINDDEILNIIQKAHPVPFGDLLVEYLKLFKKAFLNHVHNAYGQAPPTDLTSGTLNVTDFRNKSDDLEARMLSKNININ
jgi:hypothetical protein